MCLVNIYLFHGLRFQFHLVVKHQVVVAPAELDAHVVQAVHGLQDGQLRGELLDLRRHVRG